MQPRLILQHMLPLNIAIVLLACTYAMAQAGQLDTTFATKGIFAAPGERASNAVAIQSDGKIVVAGTGVFNGAYFDMLLRLNTNGTLDTSFGTGGVVNVAGYGCFGLASNPTARLLLSERNWVASRSYGFYPMASWIPHLAAAASRP